MVGYTEAEFTILADPTESTARQYGVFDLLNDGVAAPATFIVAKDGSIAWRHVASNVADRPTAEEILQELEDLQV
jgi:peroxiredoxin